MKQQDYKKLSKALEGLFSGLKEAGVDGWYRSDYETLKEAIESLNDDK